MLFAFATYRVSGGVLISVSSRALNAPVTSIAGGDVICHMLSAESTIATLHEDAGSCSPRQCATNRLIRDSFSGSFACICALSVYCFPVYSLSPRGGYSGVGHYIEGSPRSDNTDSGI